jgi:adenylosuccinate synthase
MKIDVILGLQWGDEGKGKIVDAFTPQYDIIARFQGGPNAGHTIEFNDNKVILHTIPSGILHKDKINVIGNGVVLDPVIFQNELSRVKLYNAGAAEKLYISKRAHLILPIHRALDACYELSKGKDKIGSTLKGIAPAYSDKYNRHGLRIGDIPDASFAEKYNRLTSEHLKIIELYKFDIDSHFIDGIPYREYEAKWFEGIEQMKKLSFIDTEVFINKALAEGKSILAEGAQGTLLDIDFGAYPFVTSSNTICAGVCTGLGVAPQKIGKVFGVFKAYCTRVGSGPFPTELFDETGEKLRTLGHEFGSTTGRPRRCGWLDMPSLKYAVMINGVTDLIMTKADVLSGFDTINVATSYSHKNKEVEYMPFEIGNSDINPIYTTLKGWSEDVSNSEKYEDLPESMINYIQYIKNESQVPVTIISIGPNRSQTIFL